MAKIADRLLTAALGIASLTFSAGPAGAFEMLGKGVRFENMSYSVSDVDFGGKRSTKTEAVPQTHLFVRGSHAFVSLELGDFVCRVKGIETEFGLVFSKRGAHSGTITCEPQRKGTSAHWSEQSRSGTFATTSSITRNQVALGGRLRATHTYRGQSDGWEASWTGQLDHEISIKVAASNGQCRIIEYVLTIHVRIDGLNTDRAPMHSSSVRRMFANPASTCRFLD